MQKCSVKGLALALGITWAACIVFVGITSAIWGWGTAFVEIMSSFYIGYGMSVGGIVIGAIWSFLDGAIGGAIVAWLYNRLAK